MTFTSNKNTHLNPSQGLLKLIEANAPFWGAEAEVIRSYWDSQVRTIETDRKWLTHQVYKEYWNGVHPYLNLFNEQLPQATSQEQRNKLMNLSEIVYEEVEHFVMFADLFQKLDGNDYTMTPDELKATGEWAENDALVELRRKHFEESPEIGQRAISFSEGGYCALFTEGKKLEGRGGFEDALAEVCRRIYDDEFNHMLLGIIETDSEQLTDEDWDTLERFTTAQMRQRVLMRNAQFSHPVSDERMQDLLAGKAQPVVFDFGYAEQLLSKQAA